MIKKQLSEKEKLAWLRLSRTDNVGPITFYRLLEGFGSAETALQALPNLAKRGGKKEMLKPFAADLAQKELDAIIKAGAQLIAKGEPDYPDLLANVDSAPPLITVLGHAPLLSEPSLGVVGARNASLVGRKIAQDWSKKIAEAGFVIVSGLARGIDAAAHEASLTTGTVAVVAGGIDVIYPKENENLYRQIAETGAIVAESPFGTEPIARHFPRRNRIISGLSLGVLIVEAAMKSGSLITAREAAEQGREVFAVPGSVADPRSEGTNKLIEDGAIMARNAEAVIERLRAQHLHPMNDPAGEIWKDVPLLAAAKEPEESLRQKILEMLSPIPVQVDELIRAVNAPTPDVLIIILELELAGRIERQPGNKVNLI